MAAATDALSLPEGWLTEREAEALAWRAKGKLVLEIGSWLGRSTVAMARTALHVVSVDHHHGSAEHGANVNTLPEFIANLEAAGVRDKVSVCVMDARHLYLLAPAKFDLVFVDGAHDFGSVVRDTAAAIRLVKTGGLVAFHDYSDNWPSVKAGIGATIGNPPQFLADSLAIFRYPE